MSSASAASTYTRQPLPPPSSRAFLVDVLSSSRSTVWLLTTDVLFHFSPLFQVQVFDMNSRAILRNYKGHTRAVHRTLFTASGNQVVSCSDDATVKLWDLTNEEEISQFDEHQDYIRACAVPATADHLILTGS